jgi:hypothetical protein
MTLAVVKSDTFNYDISRGTNYGPKEWNRVQCSDVATCVRRILLFGQIQHLIVRTLIHTYYNIYTHIHIARMA